MKSGSQLSDVLHVLLHLAQSEVALTSETLAAAMGTHPVVLRRLLGGLRDAGFVSSGKGHGGGWSMAARLQDITLRDVHLALGAPALVALGFRDDRPECLVAQVVNQSLQAAIQEAEAALLERLGSVTLADLSRGVGRRLKANRVGRAQATHLLEDPHAHH